MIGTLKKLEATDVDAAVRDPIANWSRPRVAQETPGKEEGRVISVPTDGWLSGAGRKFARI